VYIKSAKDITLSGSPSILIICRNIRAKRQARRAKPEEKMKCRKDSSILSIKSAF